MKKKYLSALINFTVILLCIPVFLFAQTSENSIDAGDYQIINWEKAQSAKLKAKVAIENLKTAWSCPANAQVKFANPASLTTEVTFPRPGYYLLQLTATDNHNKKIHDTVVINVFKPNSYKERLNDLIGLMTIEEKIGQLSNQTKEIQRLNVPKYNYWSEALHGILDVGVTSFPQVVALGATWDPDLVFRVASAISDEARVKNKLTGKGLSYWSPTVNIARDPRWGRNEESYSEDPYLLSQMGVAFIKGMQGNHPYYLKVVATPKHFIANNEEIRRHSGSSDVDMRSLWEYYMPAFKSAIMEGKAYSIMGAYNELNHVPCCGNYYLLTDVLRRLWGFEGYVVSDCGAINDMVSGHHFFESGAEASARGILAGCDLNCGEFYGKYLREALDANLLDEDDLDIALTRVLSARFRLGEFDPPEVVPYRSIPKEKLDAKEHRDLALETAQKAIVLLKNDGILPLDRKKLKSIAVIGPNAENCELGIYSGWPNIRISPLEGVKKIASESGIKVAYARGCEIGGGFMKPIEVQYFTEVEGTGKRGMKAEFFNNMNLEGEPVYTRIDSMVNFTWAVQPAAPGVQTDQFSVRWTGKIIPPETRTFSIGTRTDDGSRLYLNKKLLIDDWTEHGERPMSAKVEFEAGKEYEIIMEHFDNSLGASARLTWDLGQKDFESAKKAAAGKDVVILALGIFPGLSGEEHDRSTIDLPQVQQDLIREIATVNSNIIILLINGGSLALNGTEKYAKAIVEAWYAGQAGGTAMAEVLFGHVNPGGKLPETFYASTDQLPPFADYDLINNPRTYMYFDKPVLFPFGHGISYTTFEYSNLKLMSGKMDKNGEVKFQCTVKNTGKFKGDEVIQVYVSDIEASVKTSVRQLKRFKRISLDPGKEQTIDFTIPVSELSFYDIESNDFIVEPGEFEIQIGSSSQDIRLKGKFVVE
ncbi:MAG: glycoside hydrolase family 3 C-terminal domain-containing protein [Calditrichaceae bacterium]|nr:glycoside hydrolase family 3 C-terminal domain-containing protein [Calditrichaceae bacterium]RQV95599.1 MAG: glycoside hydrolase family 3 protein [Calditrichota bacterium]